MNKRKSLYLFIPLLIFSILIFWTTQKFFINKKIVGTSKTKTEINFNKLNVKRTNNKISYEVENKSSYFNDEVKRINGILESAENKFGKENIKITSFPADLANSLFNIGVNHNSLINSWYYSEKLKSKLQIFEKDFTCKKEKAIFYYKKETIKHYAEIFKSNLENIQDGCYVVDFSHQKIDFVDIEPKAIPNKFIEIKEDAIYNLGTMNDLDLEALAGSNTNLIFVSKKFAKERPKFKETIEKVKLKNNKNPIVVIVSDDNIEDVFIQSQTIGKRYGQTDKINQYLYDFERLFKKIDLEKTKLKEIKEGAILFTYSEGSKIFNIPYNSLLYSFIYQTGLNIDDKTYEIKELTIEEIKKINPKIIINFNSYFIPTNIYEDMWESYKLKANVFHLKKHTNLTPYSAREFNKILEWMLRWST